MSLLEEVKCIVREAEEVETITEGWVDETSKEIISLVVGRALGCVEKYIDEDIGELAIRNLKSLREYPGGF